MRICAAGLLASASFSLLAAPAAAADIAPRLPVKAPPMLAQAYDWSGFYAGANAGFGFGRDLTTAFAPGPGEATRIGSTGALGGGQIGYNWQVRNLGLGNLIFGFETDIQGADLESNRTCGLAICGVGFGVQYSQRLDWFGTARARIGVATGPVLSYVTGGFAYGNVETTFERLAGGGGSSDQIRTGWTAGTGVEASLGGNWTGKIEYLYLDLGTQSGISLLPTTLTFSSDIREHIFRVGLNYRVGGTGIATPEPVANWSGLYVGGNVGGAVARNPSTLGFPPGAEARAFISPIGYVGGVEIGHNWQAANWIIGLEADIQGSSQRDDQVCLLLCQPGFQIARFDQKLQWFGTVRGRLGYSIGSSLFYATGGLAYGNVTTHVMGATGGGAQVFDTSFPHTRDGYAVGGGIETPLDFFGLLGRNWTAKTEYLFVDLGETTDSLAARLPRVFQPSPFTTHVQEHIFRTGLNYHFNSPVVAKY
jgi:outer membrane immunogenic protein